MAGGEDRNERLSWWASVRLAGWKGGKLASLPLAVVADALGAGLRGRRRRRVATELVDAWLHDHRDRDELQFADLVLLLRLSEPDTEDDPWCAIDIELGPDSEITEIGAALARPSGNGYVVASGTTVDIPYLNEVIAGRWVLAHNGHDHDFPILAEAGVELPEVCIDTLRWSWLTWPSAESHALGALWELTHGQLVDTTKVHHAGTDARLLAELWTHLVQRVNALSPEIRSELTRSLDGIEPHRLIERILGSATLAWSPTPNIWSPLSAGTPHPNQVTSTPAPTFSDGDVVVTRRIKGLFAQREDAGLYSAAWLVLDADRVAEAPPSWVRAVAVSVIEIAHGASGLGPHALRSNLTNLGRSGPALATDGRFLVTDPLTAAGYPPKRPITVLDGLDGLLRPIDTGVSIDFDLGVEDGGVDLDRLGNEQLPAVCAALAAASPDDVLSALALDRVGSLVRVDDCWGWLLPAPDPSGHAHGVKLQLNSPIGGERSLVLWRSLLGSDVEVVGSAATRRPWTLLESMPIVGRRYPGRRGAVMLSLAAERQRAGGSVIVVDASAGRDAVIEVATGLWHERTGTSLLRPPRWPTIDEATRRLRTPHTAMVTSSTAQQLSPVASDLMLIQPVAPPLGSPIIRRMIDELSDGAARTGIGDPFLDVIEPLSAHLTCELIASAPATAAVTVGGRVDTAALLHDLLGAPAIIVLDETERDTELYQQLADRLTTNSARAAFSNAAVRRSTQRLLRPGQELRGFQKSITDDVLADRDVLAVFRTGLGKSLCYQVPALCLAEADAVTVVISPLLALQRDQVDSLRRRGVYEATMYNSEVAPDLRRAVRRGLAAGYYKMIFLAPEALWNAAILKVLASVDIGLIVIDEAHCISEMGHDFRPDYRTIPTAIKRILGLTHDARLPPEGTRPALLALTGTAAPSVRDDIQAALS